MSRRKFEFNSGGEFGEAIGDLMIHSPIPVLQALESVVFELDSRLPKGENKKLFKDLKSVFVKHDPDY